MVRFLTFNKIHITMIIHLKFTNFSDQHCVIQTKVRYGQIHLRMEKLTQFSCGYM